MKNEEDTLDLIVKKIDKFMREINFHIKELDTVSFFNLIRGI